MDHELKPYDALSDEELTALIEDRTGSDVRTNHQPARHRREEVFTVHAEPRYPGPFLFAASNTLHRALMKVALQADALPPRHREVEELIGWKQSTTDCGRFGWCDPETDNEYGHGASVDDLLAWLRSEGWALDEAFLNSSRYFVAVRCDFIRLTGHGDTFFDAIESAVRKVCDERHTETA